ncbi:hypothetical protein [Vibrio sp. 10N.261.51.F12]|uniref:hypothetical protein n=1 Tax=Vibrio sp. 10N.261.51.F12 TaxID=3229679 RepID=UPI00354FA6AB
MLGFQVHKREWFNCNDLSGHVTLDQADYLGLSDRQTERQLKQSIYLEFDVTLTLKMISKLILQPRALTSLWNKYEDNNYTTNLKLEQGNANYSAIYAPLKFL